MKNPHETDIAFNPEQFIRDHYDIAEKNLSSLRCIDDREDRRPLSIDALPDYAVPGAGLGIVLDAMAAAYVVSTEHSAIAPDAEELFSALEDALNNTVVFHTDTGHNGDLPCAGCGYCAASCNQPEQNLLPEAAVNFIKTKGLARCREKLEEKGVRIPAYEGSHAAKAVMIVCGDDIGLPSTSSSGVHAYVYHQDIRNELLRNAADSLYPLLVQSLGTASFSHDQWRQKVVLVAGLRLEPVLETLAGNLPRYVVTKKDGRVVCSAL
jgi:ferredoxin